MTTIGVLGPGGVGGLIAAKFIAAGHDVTVIATERTAAEITANGLTFTQADGTSTVYRPLARPALTEPVDVLFVATKATGLLPALQRVPAAVLGDATVLPLLNGVDHLPLLRAIYPDCDVVAATIAVEAIRHRPGVVEQRSPFAALVVADGTSAGADAAELLRSAGLDVSTHAEERVVLWRKLGFLMISALLTTATNAPLGQARTRNERLLRPLVSEVVAAAATDSVQLDADEITARVLNFPADAKSSMLRDFEAGRPLELDAIAGPVIRALGPDKAPTTLDLVRTILAAET